MKPPTDPSHPSSFPPFSCCGKSSGALSRVFGYENTVSGDLGVAFGYQNKVEGKSSLATGVQNKIHSDPAIKLPSGDMWTQGSCGGCVASGNNNVVSADWALVSGTENAARGYAATAAGHGNEANTWGETSLGLFAESENAVASDQVLAQWRGSDVVFRVGAGCKRNVVGTATGCPRHCPTGWIKDADGEDDVCRLDALRVHKNGRVDLRTWDSHHHGDRSSVHVHDVARTIVDLQKRVEALEAAQPA